MNARWMQSYIRCLFNQAGRIPLDQSVSDKLAADRKIFWSNQVQLCCAQLQTALDSFIRFDVNYFNVVYVEG